MNKIVTFLISILLTVNVFAQNLTQQVVIPSYIYDEQDEYPKHLKVNDSEWHHYVITKASNRTGRIYIDGELAFEGTFANYGYNYRDFYLGASLYTSWSRFFKGWIDDLKISNRVLSEEDVKQNYDSGSAAIKDVNTIALFNFDETSGSSITNQAGGTGTLFNGVEFEEGKFGNAVYFDGIDDRGDCNLDMPEDDITIEAWVRMDGEQHDKVAFQAYGMYTTSLLFFQLDENEADDLVAYYPFNGNTNDESGNGLNAFTNSAVLTKDRWNENNSAFYFDGDNDSINVYHKGELTFDAQEQFSISLWFNTHQSHLDGDQHILSHKNLTRNGINVILYDNTLTIFLEGDSDNDLNQLVTENIQVNSWYNFVFLYDGAGRVAKLYLNNELKDEIVLSDDLIGKLGNESVPFTLGKRVGEVSHTYFKGVIDDVKIYNRLLIEKEIEAIADNKPSIDFGLVAYYPFSGNANDESGNNNHGVVNGAKFVNDKFNKESSSCYFNGSSWIEINHDESINFDNDEDYTISLWAKIASDHTEGTLLAKWTNGFDSYPYTIRSHKLNEGFPIASAAYDGNIDDAVSSKDNDLYLDPDEFYHIVVIYQDQTRYLYIDGQLIGSESQPLTSIKNDNNLFLGRRGGREDRFFKGELDEIRIYNRAISIDEVNILYNEGEDLVAHYPFSGDADDLSYRENHGIVSGATLTTDRNGNENSAYSFDGVDDYIQIPDSLPVTNHFTISFWALNKKELGDATVICDGSSNAGGADFLINLKQDQIGIRADKNNLLNYEYSSPIELTNLPILNNWIHVSWVMNDGVSTIYFNGEEKYTFTEKGSNQSYHDPFAYIGARYVWGTPDEFFKGKIDDIKIFNRPLAPSEIQDLAEADNTPTNVDADKIKYFQIYPNPSSGEVNVSLIDSGDYEIEIFSVAGNKVYSTILSNSETQINFNEFANAGVYLVRINNLSTGVSLTQKIIIK